MTSSRKSWTCTTESKTIMPFFIWSFSLFSRSGQLLFEGVGHLEEVDGGAVVRDVEDRRFRILVDGHDRRRALHAGEVLHGARDPQRDVDARLDRPARLADLTVARHPARVDQRPRRGECRAELVRQFLEAL